MPTRLRTQVSPVTAQSSTVPFSIGWICKSSKFEPEIWCSPNAPSSAHPTSHHLRDLAGKIRRHRIPYLVELCGPGAGEEIVVGEGLETGALADGHAAALGGVPVDEVVAVLGDVAGDGARRAVGQLHAEPVGKVAGGPVGVVGREEGGEPVAGG